MRSSFTRLLIASAACFALVTGYGFWYAAVEAKSAAAAYLETQIATKNETAGRIASARASLADISGSEASVQGYFVPETGIVAFINSLEAQGQARGATLDVLSVSTSIVNKRSILSLSLSVKGSFDAVMRTIGVIEYAPYDLSIPTVSIGQDDKDTWHAELSLLVGSVSGNNDATNTP